MKSLLLLLAVFALVPLAFGQEAPAAGTPFQITLVGADGTNYCDSPIIAFNGALIWGTVNMTTYCGLGYDGIAAGIYGINVVPPIPSGTYGPTGNVASTGYYANGFAVNAVYILDFKNKLWSLAIADGVSTTIVNQGTFYYGVPTKAARGVTSLAGKVAK